MKFPLKAAKLAGVLAIALGAAVPATLISTPAAAYETGRDHHRDGGRDFDRDGGRHFDADRDHRGMDRHSYRGHWQFRQHRWEWIDGFWSGR